MTNNPESFDQLFQNFSLEAISFLFADSLRQDELEAVTIAILILLEESNL
ncbi:MAG: hypothetical protein NZO16_03835 [Deltaproteobacteria bacterium]|nr:hypothetical protein [Deltaproteobacteria bacterium]